jgi:putative transposase
VPSRGAVLRRIAMLDPVKTVTARQGRDAARARWSASGTSPEITGLLEQVQADHTPVDVIVVDEQHRLPAGRPAAAALQVHLDSLERVSATGRLRLQLGGA